MACFEITAKELKKAAEQLTAITKGRGYCTPVQIKIGDKSATLSVGNGEQWLEVRPDCYGIVARDKRDVEISVDALEPLAKLDGAIMVDVTAAGLSATASVGQRKREVHLPLVESEDEPWAPKLGEDAHSVMFTKETWLLETLKTLSPFRKKDDNSNLLLNGFSFRMKAKEAEACDSYRCAVRDFRDECVVKQEEDFVLQGAAYPVLTKVLDSKRNGCVDFCLSKNYIEVKGDGFTYIERRLCGDYINVQRFFELSHPYALASIETESARSALKYITGAMKFPDRQSRAAIYYKDGVFHVYANDGRLSVDEELEGELHSSEGGKGNSFGSLYNPEYLMSIFSSIQAEDVVECYFLTEKQSQLDIFADDYRYLVMPVKAVEKDEIWKS